MNHAKLHAQSPVFLKEMGIILLLALIAMATLYPMLGSFSSRLPYAGNGDIRLSLAILFSNLRHLSGLQLHQIYHLPIAYPFSFTMTAGVNLFGQTLLLLPLYGMGLHNVYVWYNLLTLLAFVASGYCAYLFFRDLCERRLIALLIAGAYMLLPFRVHNIPQLNLMYNFPIPLTFLFFRRFLKNERQRDLVFFTLALFLQALFDLSLTLFLAVALAIYFILYLVFHGLKKNPRFILALAASAVAFLLLVAALFHPYLRRDISFSNLPELQSIPRYAYHTGLSFYTNWNSILLHFKRIFWGAAPYSPGFVLSSLFLLALWPAAAGRGRRLLFGVAAALLIAPALALIIFSRSIPLADLDRLADISLALMLAALIALILCLRRTLAAEIKVLVMSWAVLLFFSSTLAWRTANLFRLLGRIFPLFMRMRGIRTEYTVMLLFLGLAAVGMRRLATDRRSGRVLFCILALLLFAERLRWPVYMERLEDDTRQYQQFYQQLNGLPDEWGLLELPFHKEGNNYYTLYTRDHRQHTYHGMNGFVIDPLALQEASSWRKSDGFPGLADPAAVASLSANGIRIVMLFKDKISSPQAEDFRIWKQTQENARRGQEIGLYERIEKSKTGIMLVLSGRQSGTEISSAVPYFALVKKRSLRFRLECAAATRVQVAWNGRIVVGFNLAAGEQKEVPLPMVPGMLVPRQNRLLITSDRPVIFDSLPLENRP